MTPIERLNQTACSVLRHRLRKYGTGGLECGRCGYSFRASEELKAQIREANRHFSNTARFLESVR